MKRLNIENNKWKLINYGLVAVVALIGFLRHNYETQAPSLYQSVLIGAFAPIQSGATSVRESVAQVINHYFLIVNTSKENVRLKTEIDLLKNNLFKMYEMKKENERLKELMQFGKEIPRQKVLAQVVGWDSSNEFKVLRINKGSDHYIQAKDPVITINGLVGYVYRVFNTYSDIITILDQNNRVDAIVSRTRSHGIVEGISKNKCILKYVSRTEQVELGDNIITAGLGTIYPKGLRVGRITKIDKESFGITQSIEVTPSVNFSKLEEVVVFTKQSNRVAQ